MTPPGSSRVPRWRDGQRPSATAVWQRRRRQAVDSRSQDVRQRRSRNAAQWQTSHAPESFRWQADQRAGAISRSAGAVVAAPRHRVRAARVEVAARRRIERRRDLALDRDERALLRLDLAGLGQQRLRVRMVRARRRVASVGPLSTTRPRYMIDDAVAEVLDHAEVVADEQVGEVERLAQLDEQVQHLRLDRHVERRDRLVADQELRLHGERARDADARALPARELVRKAAHQRRIEADAVRAASRRSRLLLAAGDEAVRDRRLADDVDDAHPRIERRVRILEDHLHLELLQRAPRPAAARRATRRASSARLRSARSSPTASRPSVDLPQPDSPTRPTTSPGAIARSTRSTACTTSSRTPAPKQVADLRRRRRAP